MFSIPPTSRSSLGQHLYWHGGKRVWDVTGAALGLALALIPLAICMVLIKLESPGPALIRQWRVGRGGFLFRLWKLRTMRPDAEIDGLPRFAARRDPRTTRMGGWLRAWHGDELPQLWNVLRGDMSLVGPRPERPQFASGFALAIPNYVARLRLRPGLTGWAQVECGYASDLASTRAKTDWDLKYLGAASWRLDWRIWCATWAVSRHGLRSRAELREVP
ncbi:MAG TPA: sugar transferase [Terriglobales bacterium]|nr:sugar transferase [Terriglobales bacterium]